MADGNKPPEKPAGGWGKPVYKEERAGGSSRQPTKPTPKQPPAKPERK
ncbi:hypothetical protein [Agromyces bauzanensis]